MEIKIMSSEIPNLVVLRFKYEDYKSCYQYLEVDDSKKYAVQINNGSVYDLNLEQYISLNNQLDDIKNPKTVIRTNEITTRRIGDIISNEYLQDGQFVRYFSGLFRNTSEKIDDLPSDEVDYMPKGYKGFLKSLRGVIDNELYWLKEDENKC